MNVLPHSPVNNTVDSTLGPLIGT